MSEIFIPDCLRNPDLYDASIDLLYDDEITEKREAVRVEQEAS